MVAISTKAATGKSKASPSTYATISAMLTGFGSTLAALIKIAVPEVQEAVTSMFRIYSRADACLAYLGDVIDVTDEQFQNSDWFSRGWTLQELLAPHLVVFLCRDWQVIGYKGARGWTRSGLSVCNGRPLEHLVSSITGIPAAVLHDYTLATTLTVQERLGWIDGRKTTEEEDMSYSLFGLFDVSTFINYGEGAERAKARLLEDIHKITSLMSVSNSETETIKSKAPYVYLPFGENQRFVGREREVDAINRRLFLEKGCQKLAVTGLGGIGKIQIALRFPYSVKTTHPDYSNFWVPALSMETLEQAFDKIAQCASQQRLPEQDVKQLVKERLSDKAAGKWLLIIDNADDLDTMLGGDATPTGLADYLPESSLGLSLYTSRSFGVAQALVGSDVVEVDSMEATESLSLLQNSLYGNRLSDEDERISATEPLEDLNGLPLVITQAAAYINVNRIAIRKYVELLRVTEQDKIELLSIEVRDRTRYKQANSAVAMTWIISFQQIAEHDLAASELLQFISCVDWKAIPHAMLPSFDSKVRLISAIGTLCSYSFLSKRGNEDMYDMHRLVHLAAQVWNYRFGDRRQT